MLGPFYSYRDREDLDRLLTAVRRAGIRITPDRRREKAFWFRRRLALVHGTLCNQQAVYFGFGHPLNPILWLADGKLLKDIGQILQSNGSRRMTINEIA